MFPHQSIIYLDPREIMFLSYILDRITYGSHYHPTSDLASQIPPMI